MGSYVPLFLSKMTKWWSHKGQKLGCRCTAAQTRDTREASHPQSGTEVSEKNKLLIPRSGTSASRILKECISVS